MVNPGAAAEPEYIQEWPALPYEAWKHTYETLHMWTQIVGKVRLALSPMLNHWWQVTLYVTSRGLSTSPVPVLDGAQPRTGIAVRTFEIAFDFIDHKLSVITSDGQTRYIGLQPRSVSDFYRELMSTLRSLGIDVRINTMPQEVPNPIPFDQDTVHASYDAEYANRFWRILVQTDSVFEEFRGRYLGKCSPVHFFWGACDLAVTRFTGRLAPERPGADQVQREAYSHECSSAGFWPGSGPLLAPAYYAYTVPEPAGLAEARVRPDTAYYHKEFWEHILLYDDVRTSSDPRGTILDFMQSTYEAGANLAGWDRAALERRPAR